MQSLLFGGGRTKLSKCLELPNALVRCVPTIGQKDQVDILRILASVFVYVQEVISKYDFLAYNMDW